MAKSRDITVSLPRELHQFLQRKVKEDDYLDPADVVREALLEFKEQDEFRAYQLQKLRGDVAVGLQQVARGELVPAEQVFARVRRRLAARRRKSG